MDSCHKECAGCQKKHREDEQLKKLMNRLNRIEGQVRGIKGMLEKDAYCIDIITQVSAIQSALGGFNKELLKEHIATCVVEDVKLGKEEKVDELIHTLQKLI
ncbi:MAG: metal-sensing transcriptional repressor [Eubacteriales bacterium]|nr:metal-sensing transcriptional repressor [Eubacteriales bacterium]